MKYFSSLFALIGVVILMVELSIFNNQYNLFKRDFDTARLSYAIEYAEEGAFAQSLQTGNISSDYTDLLNVTSDPTFTLDIFAFRSFPSRAKQSRKTTCPASGNPHVPYHIFH